MTLEKLYEKLKKCKIMHPQEELLISFQSNEMIKILKEKGTYRYIENDIVSVPKAYKWLIYNIGFKPIWTISVDTILSIYNRKDEFRDFIEYQLGASFIENAIILSAPVGIKRFDSGFFAWSDIIFTEENLSPLYLNYIRYREGIDHKQVLIEEINMKNVIEIISIFK